jgi:homoserine dehydrogenase
VSNAPIAVLKFGSSVLPDEAHLVHAVKEIREWRDAGYRVIAVVSALGSTTDNLIAKARKFARKPDDIAYAALLATGEATAVALLALELADAGLPADILDPGAIGLRTTGPKTDATASSLDVAAVHRALNDRPVLVVPGFIGRDELGRATLLGRGGSDLSALFIAHALKADAIRLVKDVDGLYDRDPAADPLNARRYRDINWDEVLSLSEGIVQHKAVRYAKERGLAFYVGSLGRGRGTLVGPGPTVFDAPAGADRKCQECAA